MLLFIKQNTSVVMNSTGSGSKRKIIKFKMHFEVIHNLLYLPLMYKIKIVAN